MSTEGRKTYLAKRRRQEFLIRFTQLAMLIVFVVSWELLARWKFIDAFIFSQPSRIWDLMLQLTQNGELLKHVGVTLGETVAGFVLGTIMGLLISVMLWWSPSLAKILDPYLVVLNATPKIALGPIFIVWMGNGYASILTMALTISVITTITIIYSGFGEVEQGYARLMQSFGSPRSQILLKVVLPASFQTIIAALKVNISLTLVGVIVGEFLVSKAGLGYLIIYGGQVFQLHLVIMSIVVLALMAYGLYQAVSILEKRLLGAHGFAETMQRKIGAGG